MDKEGSIFILSLKFKHYVVGNLTFLPCEFAQLCGR